MKRLLHPLVFAIALFLVFEEWLWDKLKHQLRRLSMLPPVAALETWLRSLGSYASLLVLCVPAIILLPCKIAALWALSHHHHFIGLLVLIGAKLLGTAIAAYLFDLVRASARRLAWFDRLYLAVTGLFSRAKVWLFRQPSAIAARAVMARCKLKIDVMLLRRPSSRCMRRKLSAAKALARARVDFPVTDAGSL